MSATISTMDPPHCPPNRIKKLSPLQLFNLSAGIIGLQFAWSLQIALSSRILEPLGANPFLFGLIWCAGPITGLLIQPVVGALSDRTWTRLGRRRPYVLAGSVLGACAIFAFPFSQSLWIAALLTWLIDACLNTAQGPYRALIPDNAPPEQHAVANSFINFAFGIGSVIALGVAPLLKVYRIPMSIEQQYMVASAALLLTITYASLSIREIRPASLQPKLSDAGRSADTTDTKKNTQQGLMAFIHRFINGHREIHKLCAVQFITWVGLMCMYINLTPFVVHQVYGLPDMSTPQYKALESQWHRIEPVRKNMTSDPVQLSEARKAMETLQGSPATLAEGQLSALLGTLMVNRKQWTQEQSPALNQNLSLESRVAIQKALLELPSISETEARRPLTNLSTSSVKETLARQLAHLQLMKSLELEATNTAQLALVAYNFVALLLTIPLGYLCNLFGKKRLYSLSLLAYAGATAFAPWVHTPEQIILMMGVAGIGGATILSLPFAMLCEYLPEGDEGVILGIFNVFICAPQLISALVIGKLIEMSPMKTVFGTSHQWWIAFATASVFVFLSMLALQAFRERYPGRMVPSVSSGH